MQFTRRGRELLFNGQPANLAGIIAGANGVATTDALNPPFDNDLTPLTNFGNNFFRHWLIPYWKYSPVSAIQQRNCLFTRQGAKWNLQAFYADYFTRLRQMITRAGQMGVAVQLLLFDRCGLDFSKPGEAPVRRWDDSPWNSANNVHGVVAADPAGGASGLPEFYRNESRLRSLQAGYIRHAVQQTKAWNVFYEVMNEPMGGSSEERVRWADWAVGVIHSVTLGQNLIFYNDHTGGARGADVNAWKALNLPNYHNFHGVILHGRPTDYNPDNTAYRFRAEKIFQLSSDGGPAGERDTEAANYTWTQYAFSRRMMFQAHTLAPAAARGIGRNHPTRLVSATGTGAGDHDPIEPDPIGPRRVEDQAGPQISAG